MVVSPKSLVLCADDYAQHAGVTQAVLALATQGRLGATSAMVLSPRWREDAAPLRELRDRIDVGLHLDFTSDFAIDAGHGLPLGAAMRRALWGGFDADAPTLGLKAGGYWPHNQDRGLINHQSTVFLFDPDTGRVSAAVGGNLLTALRTAAARL